jgi:hypothetical protein
MLITRSSGVYAKEIDGQIVILEKNKEYIRKLNKTASFLWEQLTKPKTIDQLTAALIKKFKVNQEQANQDVANWVKVYLKEGFLEEVKD